MLTRLIPRLWWIGLLAEVIVLCLAWIESQGDSTDFFQAAARLSGRVSLVFFSILLIYATRHPGFLHGSSVWKSKLSLYRDFAMVHAIHWCLLAVAVQKSGFELDPVRVAGGILAYALVVGMPLLVHFNVLHTNILVRVQAFYLFWVWLVFFLTYVTRLRGQTPIHSGSPIAWWPLVIVTGALMAWRLYRIATRRSAM
jgi:hypothetical protein